MSSILGRRLRELRGTKTQEEIADLLGIGRAAYGHIERGVHAIDSTKLEILADYYHCSVDYILGRTDERMPDRYDFEKDSYLSDKNKDLLRIINDLPTEQIDALLKLLDGIQSPSKNLNCDLICRQFE